jgi:hypothetical protein
MLNQNDHRAYTLRRAIRHWWYRHWLEVLIVAAGLLVMVLGGFLLTQPGQPPQPAP